MALGAYVAYQTVLNGQRARELTVGRVLVNMRDDKTVLVQPHVGRWSRVRVIHLPLYQTANGYVTEVGPTIAKETVRYEALVSQVELLHGGELSHGSTRRLSDRG